MLSKPPVKFERCLNCDMETAFVAPKCIECDACIDICPVQCLTITRNGEEDDLRQRLSGAGRQSDAPDACLRRRRCRRLSRVMFKDEDLCVHCGLCAERCPTAAWDMQKFELLIKYAGAEVGTPTLRRVIESYTHEGKPPRRGK